VGVVTGALDGVRVVDFSWVGAGSFTTRLLAEHGADVIKIESSTHLDSLRIGPPFAGGVKGVNRSGYFAERNAEKRSVTVDLKRPEGAELVRRLIESADIVANNFRPGVMDGLGFGYDEVAAINPGVIYLAMSMQGATGPESTYLGYGITIAAVSGLTALSAEPGRYPVGTGTHFPDHIPNPGHAVVAVLAALRHRRRTGEGQQIELAQTETTIAGIGPQLMRWTAEGEETPPRGNRDPRWAPHGVFPTAGADRWIAIVARDDAEWQALAAELGLDAAATPTAASRLADADRIGADVAQATRDRDGVDLMHRLQSAGVPAGVVADARFLVDEDPQLAARGHWRRLDHPEMGRALYGTAPFRLSATPGVLERPAPLLGQHTRDVLHDLLGLDDARIDALEADGVLR
jgi:benzylsuccinate CoA-transferase BbsF subunit